MDTKSCFSFYYSMFPKPHKCSYKTCIQLKGYAKSWKYKEIKYGLQYLF